MGVISAIASFVAHIATSRWLSRILLLALNAFLAFGGGAILYYGVRHRITKPDKTRVCSSSGGVLQDPFVLLIGFGSVVLALGVYGLLAALCKSKKHLQAYYFVILCAMSGILYTAAFCLAFGSQADAIVERNWQCLSTLLDQDQNDEKAKQNLKEALGDNLRVAFGMCVACAVLLALALHWSAVVAGYKWMMRRVMVAVNTFTGIASAILFGLSIHSSKTDWLPVGSWIPAVGITVGVIGFLGSVNGFTAAKKKSLPALKCHIAFTGVLFLTSAVTMGYAITNAEASSNWIRQQARKNLHDPLPWDAWQNLVSMGIALALLSVILVFNFWASIYLLAVELRRLRERHLDPAERDELLDSEDEDSSGNEAPSPRSSRRIRDKELLDKV